MIRKAKSEAKLSMRASVESANFVGTAEMTEHLNLVAPDLKAAGSIKELTHVVSTDAVALAAEITLAQ